MARIDKGHNFLSGFANHNFLEEYSMGRGFNSSPIVNISENDKRYKLELGIPGIKKEELDVKVDESMLLIRSKIELHEEDMNEQFHVREMNTKNFKRLFNLPNDALADQIKANYKDGILQILIPKKDGFENNASTVNIN